MRKLLLLRFEIDECPQPIEGYDDFQSIAKEEGLAIETVRLGGSIGETVDVSAIKAALRGAHGYWIRQTHIVNDENLRGVIEERLREGAVAIAELRGVPQKEDDHLFFRMHGLETSPVRLVRRDTETLEYGSPMLVAVDKTSYPIGFRDPSLFKGVTRLVLQQANAIGCFGGAEPVLTVPAKGVKLLDIRSDYFFANASRPELPVIASSSHDNWRGRIIALNGSLFHDAYDNPFGGHFPGIKAADNAIFARNLLRVIGGGVPSPDPWDSVSALVGKIEENVALITRRVLSEKSQQDWFFELVPSEIQTKCIERQRSENQAFPPAAYLDLIDYKKIWKQNWDHFSPLINAVAPPASKSNSIAFLQRTNDWRKPIAHPTKRILGGVEPPSREDVARLEEDWSLAVRLHSEAKKGTS